MISNNCTEEEIAFLKEQCEILCEKEEKIRADFNALIKMVEDEALKEQLRNKSKNGIICT